MSQHNGSMGGDLLDDATHRLRDARGSEIPPGLVGSTVDAIRSMPMPVMQRRTLGGMALRLSGIAATILLALAGVVALVMQGGANVALAQVLDRVKNADSVEFVLSPGPGQATEKEQKCVLHGEKLRVQHPIGIVMIADRKAKEGLYLDGKSKTAGRFTLHEHLATEFATDPVTQLRQVRSDSAERLGKEVIDGKDAEVFRVHGIKLFGAENDKGEMRVWVDSMSMLPLRIELRMGETPLVTLKEMKWNSAIDPSLLSMEIPDGYAEQPEEAFRKLLRPDADGDKRLTPNEAFRKWRGESK